MLTNLKQPRAILFDFGGVLFDTNGVDVLLAWLGNRVSEEALWRIWLTSPTVRAFETGKMPPETFADTLISDLALPVSRQEFLSGFMQWHGEIRPGAVDLVRRIPESYIKAALCNTNSVHWACMTELLPVGELFEHCFASHLTGRLKPDQDAFQYVSSSLACAPPEILFLDDQPLNVDAARSMGIRAVRVTSIAEAETVLAEAGVIGLSKG